MGYWDPCLLVVVTENSATILFVVFCVAKELIRHDPVVFVALLRGEMNFWDTCLLVILSVSNISGISETNIIDCSWRYLRADSSRPRYICRRVMR